MDTAAIALGIGTILASGVMSSVVTYRLNRGKAQFEFMREKAEQLYLSANEYGKVLGSHGLTYFPVLKGEINWNQMLDMHLSAGPQKEHGGADTMTMLVDIYFPSVRPALADVFAARDDFNKFTGALRQRYLQEGHVTDPEFRAPFMAKLDGINASIRALQEAVIKTARGYAGIKQD